MKIVFLLLFISITLKAEAQNKFTKADSTYFSKDYGWVSGGLPRVIPTGDYLLDLGFHFTPQWIGKKNSPYFFELKHLFEVTLGDRAVGISSLGFGYTQSNYVGRSALSAGFSYFKSESSFDKIKVTGLGLYVTGSAFAAPYLPVGIGLQSSLYLHPKQVIAFLGLTFSIEGTK